MDDDLARMLTYLRLPNLRERWDEYLTLARKKRYSPVRLLQTVLEDEVRAKRGRALERRLRLARIPEMLLMETFPFDRYLPGLRRFFQGLLDKMGNPKADGVWNDTWDDALDFTIYEMWLYSVAALLAEERLELAARWVSMRYTVQGYDAGRERYGVFLCNPRSIYAWNDGKEPKKWLNPVGQILKERASNEIVSWTDLIQADLTLWLRSTVDEERWWPNTAVYGRYGRALPLYIGVEEEDVWTPLRNLFGVDRRESLKAAATQAWRSRPIRHSGGMGDEGENIWRLLNLKKMFHEE